eukprot:SAG11_NODE_49041_length_120_cov_50.666667_1_plen_23_part_01
MVVIGTSAMKMYDKSFVTSWNKQ